ncbi:unnamed protein product [Schistosoma rodhaini]|uniref:Putative dna-directed RNA polymerase I n=2 Tax=Schistosoma mansoni TaxID=6183 RepID=G4VD46_SCHMA|nr:putative dna-directed RNA polymerase I [Schistosoma mansoni]CAH8504752.1 unnamed protein product [Schistosoma rodhaini]|eukprot:XP_018650440.1 putative dna-directed RNA polymerase I [Schistosoma mansoni]
MESRIKKTCYELKDHGVLHHPGVEDRWSLSVFKKKFHVEIIRHGEESDTMEFDMINLDCSFANAVRRILVSEVPSLAIERVYVSQNTSIMPDEVMCHRLGLIPLAVDPKYFLFPTRKPPASDDLSGFDPKEHLVYDLCVGFTHSSKDSHNKPEKDKDDTLPVAQYLPVYSSDLKWIPLAGQEDHFNINNPPIPVSSTILINKLALGDEIEARCVAVKGIGRDHAKFSPVAAAYYKFHPIIKLLRTIEGEQAIKLQKSFASGVIGINSKTGQAFVDNARLDNGSREHMRHPEFRDDVIFVGMDSSHCIFTVETIAPGSRPPSSLVRCALGVMISKCSHYMAVTETPGFGDHVEECKPLIDIPKNNTEGHTSEKNLLFPKGNRSYLNGREVGLEVAHISQDKSRATFTFFGEDHTLGLALRYCILRDESVSFCGYCVPHPLEDMINFDIQMKKGSAIDALRNGLQCLRDCFQHMKHTFISAMKISRSTRKSS